MMRSYQMWTAVATTALSCVAMPCAAQSAPSNDAVRSALAEAAGPAVVRETSVRIGEQGTNGGDSGSGVQTQGPTLTLNAASGEGAATLTLELLSNASADRVGTDGRLTAVNNRLVAEISTELGEDESLGEVLNVGGVTNGTSLTLTWTRFSIATNLNGDTVTAGREILDRARRVCIAQALSTYQGRADDVTAFQTDFSATMTGDLHSQMIALRTRHPDVVAALGSRCFSETSITAFVTEHLGDDAGEALQLALYGNRPTLFMGVSGSVGTANYDFIDTAAFAESDVDRVEWAVSGHIGWVSANGRNSGRLRVGYAREWEAADEIDICQPSATAGLLNCLNGPGAAPQRSQGVTASAEFRQVVTLAGFDIGFAPQVGYRGADEQFTASLPIYFIPDPDGGLTAGVRFGFDSEAEDEWSAGVFISTALSRLF